MVWLGVVKPICLRISRDSNNTIYPVDDDVLGSLGGQKAGAPDGE